ncbi:hypothetical protein FO519_008538, partial [Halicephalobus sp. NKZ332]
MMLNPCLHCELAKEFTSSSDKDEKALIGFMMTGKEPLAGLHDFVNNVDKVSFVCMENRKRNNEGIPCHGISSYKMMFQWDEGIEINIGPGHAYMKNVVRWALFAVKTVEINYNKLLPADATDLLVKNPNFTELSLWNCDFPTAKLLLESRKFKYINIDSVAVENLAENLNDIHINAKTLQFGKISLEKILKAEFISATRLAGVYLKEYFDDNLLTVDIGSSFRSLGYLELTVENDNPIPNVERLLKFLRFFDENFDGLCKIVLTIHEKHPEVVYNNDQGNFNISPSSFRKFVNYWNILRFYTGGVNIKFSHYICVDINSSSRQAVEGYVENLKNELPKFHYSSPRQSRGRKSRMRLNPDLYRDLSKEMLNFFIKPEDTTIFMISGRELFIAFKEVITKAKAINLSSNKSIDCSCDLQNIIEKTQDHHVYIFTKLDYPYIQLIIRWGLSFIKKVRIYRIEKLPVDVVDLMLKNPNLKILELDSCSSSIAKALVESRKFDQLNVSADVFMSMRDIHIDTEELEVDEVCLENILQFEYIKTKSLIISYQRVNFNYHLTNADVHHSERTFKTEDILNFLEFVNTKFTNVKYLVLDFVDHYETYFDCCEKEFGIEPTFFTNLMRYQDKLKVYDGKVKVKLNHEIECWVLHDSQRDVENYSEDFKKELPDFEFFSDIECDIIVYKFEKS